MANKSKDRRTGPMTYVATATESAQGIVSWSLRRERERTSLPAWPKT